MKALCLKTEFWANSCSVADYDVGTRSSLASLASPADRRVIFDKEPDRLLRMTPKPFLQRLADITGNVRFFVGLGSYSAQRLGVARREEVMAMTAKSCTNWCFQLGRNRREAHAYFSPSASISAITASASFNACVRVQSIRRLDLKICTASSLNTRRRSEEHTSELQSLRHLVC